LAQSRKRRKERQRAAAQARPEPAASPGATSPAPAEPAASPAPEPAEASAAAQPAASPERGYARSRAKDEAARAALQPLAPGERPTAVTVGAIVAALLGLANLIAVVAGWDGAAGEDDRARALAGSILVAGLLFVVAWGMWHARYWAVLGMQTLLALTLIASALGLVTASSAWGAVVLVAILAAAGTLFWFMVKAMARIQMPERPTRAR
jgi:cation transport ATPase